MVWNVYDQEDADIGAAMTNSWPQDDNPWGFSVSLPTTQPSGGGFMDAMNKLLDFQLQRDKMEIQADLIKAGRAVGYNVPPGYYGYAQQQPAQSSEGLVRLLLLGGMIWGGAKLIGG